MGIKIKSIKNKIIQDIIKENIDVIKMNLQKKYQCADKEYMLTGNKDRLKEISEMLFYIDYLEKRKEYKIKSLFQKIPFITKVNKYGIEVNEIVFLFYIDDKLIKQENFKKVKIKGVKTLWKK